jgi:predicted ferric reductase
LDAIFVFLWFYLYTGFSDDSSRNFCLTLWTKTPNNSTTEVVMRAKKDRVKEQRAGQFLFVRFPKEKTLNESHPFTISSAPREDVLRLTIKASGDFTRHLFGNLQAGTDAIIEGAYGMFDYKTGGKKQIWVAGGMA